MYSLMFPLSIAIFISTLILVIKKPWKLDIGYSALIGAAVSYLLGTIVFSSVIEVWGIIWNATFTFVAIIIISLIFDEAGFFEYSALRIARLAGGRGRVLFVLVILLGSGISAVFANDGTALILTPIVYEMLKRLKMDKKLMIPFIMATGFIADSSSLPLNISNLVNLVSATYFRVSFLSYARVMIIPDVVSIVTSLVLLYLFYRKSIPGNYSVSDLGNPSDAIKEPEIFRLALPTIVVLMILYSVGGIYSVPVSFISVSVAAALLIVSKFRSHINIPKVLKEAPWQIVIFSFGMYLVVFGMGREGLTAILTSVFHTFTGYGQLASFVLSGYLGASLAAGMNNLPSVMLGALAIGKLSNPGGLIYVNVIANDIGPKFTPIGSLATLLWLFTLNKKEGIKIGYAYYMKVGFVLALPVLTITLISLYLVFLI